jgi:hypothetical protein
MDVNFMDRKTCIQLAFASDYPTLQLNRLV